VTEVEIEPPENYITQMSSHDMSNASLNDTRSPHDKLLEGQ
jgi:hypothetical protein